MAPTLSMTGTGELLLPGAGSWTPTSPKLLVIVPALVAIVNCSLSFSLLHILYTCTICKC